MIMDPISDMLTRIRNACKVKKTEVVLPYSKLKASVADILVKTGYVQSAQEQTTGVFPELKVVLRYKPDGEAIIHSIRRISKPGCRIYSNKEGLPIVLNHMGVAIISTSQGVMTNKEAKKKGIGGEVICEVY